MDFSKEEIFNNDVFRSLPLDKRIGVANKYAEQIGIFDNETFNNLQKPTGEHELVYSEDQQIGFEDGNMTPQGQTQMKPIMVEDIEKKNAIRDKFLDNIVQPSEDELLNVSRVADTVFKVPGDIAGSITGNQTQIDRGFARDYIGRKIEQIKIDPNKQNVQFNDVEQTQPLQGQEFSSSQYLDTKADVAPIVPAGQPIPEQQNESDTLYKIGQYYPYVALGFATGGVGGVQGAALDIGLQGLTSYLANKNKYGGEKEIAMDMTIDWVANAFGLGLAKFLKAGQIDEAAQAAFGKSAKDLTPDEVKILDDLKTGVQDIPEPKLDEIQIAARDRAINKATKMFDDMTPEVKSVTDVPEVDTKTFKQLSEANMAEDLKRSPQKEAGLQRAEAQRLEAERMFGADEDKINEYMRIKKKPTNNPNYEKMDDEAIKYMDENTPLKPSPPVTDEEIENAKSIFTKPETVGAMYGFEQDENGNWTYNIEKGLLGAGGAKLAGKALSSDMMMKTVNKLGKKVGNVLDDIENTAMKAAGGGKPGGSFLERKRLEKANMPNGRKLYHPTRDKHYLYDKETDTVYFEARGKWREMPNEEIRSDVKFIDEKGVVAFKDKLKGIEAEDNRIAKEIAKKEASQSESYKLQHTAPTKEYGASGDNLKGVFPDDIYSKDAQRFYGHGDKAMDEESLSIIRKIKDNPDADVTIYRAIPKELDVEINPNDWVTISKRYATEHGDGPLKGEYKILEKRVKAREIFTDGNSIHEWGYSPEKSSGVKIQSNPLEAIRYMVEEPIIGTMNGIDWLARKAQKALLKGKTLDEVIASSLKAKSDNKVIDAIKKAVVQDYRLSDQYLALADKAQIAIKRGENEASKMFEVMRDIPEADLTKLHNFVAGESDEIPSHLRGLANSAKRAVLAKTQELVSLGLLPEDIAKAYKGGYLRREYEGHIKKTLGDMFFNQQKKLSKQYKRGKEFKVTKEEYEQFVKNGEVGENIRDAKYVYEGTEYDKVKLRRDWTAEERREMKEITNASFTVPSTVMKLQRDIAYGKFLTEVATDESLSSVIKTAEDMKAITGVSRVSDIPTHGTGYQQLSGSQYGKLNGMWIEDATANDIKGFKESLYGDDREVKEAWKSLLTEWKVAKTVKNPTAHMNNFLSNMIMSYYAGIKPSKIMANTANAIMELKNGGKYLSEAEEIGLLGRSKLEEIRRVVDKPVATQRSIGNKIARNLYMAEDSKLGSMAFKLYSLEDDISRLALYTHYRKAGQTPQQAMKSSGKVVFDYTRRMPPALRGARDSGLIPFVSWTYKSLPLMFETMFKRPSRYAALVGAYVLIDNMINKDAEKPEFMRGKYLTLQSDSKESLQVRTASMTPYFDWFTEPLEAGKQLGLGGIPQKVVEGLAGRQFWNDQKITYRKGGEAFLDYGLWTVNSLLPTPAYMSKVYNVGEAIVNDGKQVRRNKLFKPRSTAEAAAGLFGFNVRTYNKAEQRKRDIEKKRKELRSR